MTPEAQTESEFGKPCWYSDPEQGKEDPRGRPELWVCSAPSTRCELDGLPRLAEPQSPHQDTGGLAEVVSRGRPPPSKSHEAVLKEEGRGGKRGVREPRRDSGGSQAHYSRNNNCPVTFSQSGKGHAYKLGP